MPAESGLYVRELQVIVVRDSPAGTGTEPMTDNPVNGPLGSIEILDQQNDHDMIIGVRTIDRYACHVNGKAVDYEVARW
jgi:hypothetical protein